MERMKDVYAKMAKAEGKMEAVCEQCVEGKSVRFVVSALSLFVLIACTLTRN